MWRINMKNNIKKVLCERYRTVTTKIVVPFYDKESFSDSNSIKRIFVGSSIYGKNINQNSVESLNEDINSLLDDIEKTIKPMGYEILKTELIDEEHNSFNKNKNNIIINKINNNLLGGILNDVSVIKTGLITQSKDNFKDRFIVSTTNNIDTNTDEDVKFRDDILQSLYCAIYPVNEKINDKNLILFSFADIDFKYYKNEKSGESYEYGVEALDDGIANLFKAIKRDVKKESTVEDIISLIVTSNEHDYENFCKENINGENLVGDIIRHYDSLYFKYKDIIEFFLNKPNFKKEFLIFMQGSKNFIGCDFITVKTNIIMDRRNFIEIMFARDYNVLINKRPLKINTKQHVITIEKQVKVGHFGDPDNDIRQIKKQIKNSLILDSNDFVVVNIEKIATKKEKIEPTIPVGSKYSDESLQTISINIGIDILPSLNEKMFSVLKL